MIKIDKHLIFIMLVLILGIVIVFGPTMLDFIGNRTMFEHGLVFSWTWFIPWAIGLHITVAGTSISNAIIYWWARGATKRSRVTAFLIGLTSYWQLIAGNEDFIWFTVFDGGLPPLNKVWWWMPQDWIVKWINPAWNWTTACELVWIAIFNLILISFWVLWYRWIKTKNQKL